MKRRYNPRNGYLFSRLDPAFKGLLMSKATTTSTNLKLFTMHTLQIELDENDLQNSSYILKEIAKMIDDGFHSGIECPVNWKLSKGSNIPRR